MNTRTPHTTVSLRCAPRVLPARYTQPRVRKPLVTAPKFSVVDASAVVGKGVVLFTMFYTGLNWLMYRTVRIKAEEQDKTKK